MNSIIEQMLEQHGTATLQDRKNGIKGNTREHLLTLYADERMAQSVSGNEVIKVKFEVDTTPPPYASFERKYRLLPIPYEINLYDMPSLFAGKLHAVICRA